MVSGDSPNCWWKPRVAEPEEGDGNGAVSHPGEESATESFSLSLWLPDLELHLQVFTLG